MKKKLYVSPRVKSLRISPTLMSASQVAVGAKDNNIVTEESDAFWSNSFGGTITDDDDDTPSNNNY